jgi:hypothetical protein
LSSQDGPHSPWAAPGSPEKKELVLTALTMTQEEFDKLTADRNELIVESSGVVHAWVGQKHFLSVIAS